MQMQGSTDWCSCTGVYASTGAKFLVSCFRPLCRRADHGPLLALGGHARWVWRVRHNPVHDALVLTSAGDSLRCLACCKP